MDEMASNDIKAPSNDAQSESAVSDPSIRYSISTNQHQSATTDLSSHIEPVRSQQGDWKTIADSGISEISTRLRNPLDSPDGFQKEVFRLLEPYSRQSRHLQEQILASLKRALVQPQESQQVLEGLPAGQHLDRNDLIDIQQESGGRIPNFLKRLEESHHPAWLDKYYDILGTLDLAKEAYDDFVRVLDRKRYQQRRKVHFDETASTGQNHQPQQIEGSNRLTLAEFEQAKDLIEAIEQAHREVQEVEKLCKDAKILTQETCYADEIIIYEIVDEDWNSKRTVFKYWTPKETDDDLDTDLFELPPPCNLRPGFTSLDADTARFSSPSHTPPGPDPDPPAWVLKRHNELKAAPSNLAGTQASPVIHPRGVPPHISEPRLLSPSNQVRPHVSIEPASAVMARETLFRAFHQQFGAKLPPASFIHEVTYDVSWELPAFFITHVPSGSKLSSLLLLTSSADANDAFATTCEDYMHKFWPSLGPLLLHAIEDMLRDFDSGFSEGEQVMIKVGQKRDVRQKLESLSLQDESDLLLEASEPCVSNATISVRGTFDDQVSLATAIMWLSSAVRYPGQGLDLSETLFSPVSNYDSCPWPRLQISLKSLQPVAIDTTRYSCCCWHKLFDRQVIASGFRIPERKVGHGLEIPYQDMLLLARSKGLAKIHGGLLPEGFSTLLIPVEEIEEVGGSSIQWHLEMKPRENPNDFQILTAEMFDQIWRKPWLKMRDETSYLHQRTFLGWTTKAVVIAGTSIGDNLGVELSGYEEIDAVVKKSTFGVGVRVGWSPFSISVEHTTTPSLVASSVEKMDMEDTYSDLQAAITSHSVVYDTDAETAWVLHRTSIILLMCHVILKRRKEEVDHKTCPAYPEPLPCKDAGLAAFEAIKASLKWTIPKEKAFSKTPTKPQKFASLVQGILINFRKSESLLRQSRNDRAQCGKGAPDYIIGVELIDVAIPQYGFIVKEAAISKPWAHFTTKQLPLVFFCKNLGQPIVSWGPEPICANWKTVPPKQKYLVAMGSSVSHTLKSVKVCWKPKDKTSLFTKHGAGAIPKDCNHVQNLSINRSSGPPDMKAMEMVEDGEAYIFGSGQKVAKSQPLASQNKHSGVGSTLNPNQRSQTAESSPLDFTSQSSRLPPFTHNNTTKSLIGNTPPLGLTPSSPQSKSALSGGISRLASSSQASFTSPDFQESGEDEEVDDEIEGDGELEEKGNEENVLKRPVYPREPSARNTSITQSPQSAFDRRSSDCDTGWANSRSHTRPTINVPSLPYTSPRSPGLRHKKKSMNLTERGRQRWEATFADPMTSPSSEPRMKNDSARLLNFTVNSTEQPNQNILSNGDVEMDDDERLEVSIGKEKGKQKEEMVRPRNFPIAFSLPIHGETTEPTLESQQEEPKQFIVPFDNDALDKPREQSSNRKGHLATTERVGESSRGESERQQRPRNKKGRQHRQSGKGKQDK